MRHAVPLVALFVVVAVGAFFGARAIGEDHRSLAATLREFEHETGVRITPADCASPDRDGTVTCASDEGIVLYTPSGAQTGLEGAYFSRSVGAPAGTP